MNKFKKIHKKKIYISKLKCFYLKNGQENEIIVKDKYN